MDDEQPQQTPAEQLDHISQTVHAELKARCHNLETRGRATRSLSEAEEQLQHLKDLRITYLGKKNEFAKLKKLIGRLPAEQRANFGQRIQQTEEVLVQAF